MPPVAAAVLIAAASAAATYATTYFALATVASLVLKAALAVAATVISGKLFGPKQPDFSSEALGRTVVIRSPIQARRTIYGQVMVSGPLMFATTTGSENGMLHMVIALAGHEVEEIGDVYFNDKLESEYDQTDPNQIRINKHLGSSTQLADSDLVSQVPEWTNAHRLQGVAYVYVRLLWSAKIFPTGIPNVKCIVKGKKIYDPRTGVTAWTQNPALALRDYLNGAHGLLADADEIDDVAIVAAANICDEVVTVPDGAGGTTTEARYSCNGVIVQDTAPLDNLGSLLTSCVGACTYVGGQYKITAGSYIIPTLELNEDDLRGPIQVQGAVPRKELYNAIRGIYVEPLDSWAPTDMPPVTNTGYAASDGGTVFREIELPYTTSVYTAQRIGKVHLEQSRQRLTISFPAKLSAFRLSAWDTVMISIERFNWNRKTFRVLEWTFAQDGGVDLVLREDNPGIWDWVYTEAMEPVLPVNISNADEAEPGPPTGLTVTDTEIITTVGVDLSWTAPVDDPHVIIYEVQYKITADTDWINAGSTTDTSLRITGLEPDTAYSFQVRSRYNSGAVSAWVSATRTSGSWAVFNPEEIKIWSGAIIDIPTGYSLCDGNNGTLDLRSVFIVGAGTAYAVGDTGGATTDTSSNPSATTTVDNNGDGSTVSVGSSTHTHEVDTLPPYYALAYIQYTG